MTRHIVTNVEVAKIKVKLPSPFFCVVSLYATELQSVLSYSTRHSRCGTVSRSDSWILPIKDRELLKKNIK